MNCKINLTDIPQIECSNITPRREVHSFKNGEWFIDGQYMGKVVKQEGNRFTVRQQNGGLSDGTERVIVLIPKNPEK